ncbi:MAG: hypothetical protein MZV64_62465 [Ignavibacteriales bacterium]|nr:hypothetical protein [Ignavibacteriales bacterium]
MASTNSVSSLDGLVSSKRRYSSPPNSLRGEIVDQERLDMPDVQIAVRLGWQARADVVEASVLQIFGNGFADERGDSAGGFFWLIFCLGSKRRRTSRELFPADSVNSLSIITKRGICTYNSALGGRMSEIERP